MALFTQAEIQLAAERRLKYQGKAKINLDQIQVPLDSDTKKLERLRGIFLKEGCLRLDDRNHVVCTVSPHKHLMDPLSIDLPKPSVPYVEGWVFSIQSHIPPPLTPVTKDCCRNFQAGRVERRQLRPVERCLRHPPLPGNMEPRTVNLKVLDLLRVGDGCNAQVFTVQVLEVRPDPRFFQSNKKLVAKIYDPLYFSDEEGFINPFLCVDKHYNHEAHALTMSYPSRTGGEYLGSTGLIH
ncbi:hypothetical protein GX48_03234 [Paracoccidioides brasiliensis]|nr:hypothetical protein GX48_03234 [Paracoccidioides brasiliensis]